MARVFASLVVVVGAGLLTTMGVGSLALTSAAAPSGHEVSHAASTSCGGTLPAGTVVGIAATKDDGGYWIADNAGVVVACGDATDFGGLTTTPAQPIVGIAATPDGGGFYLVASDGGVFTFGDAVFQGSTGAIRLNKPVVGMAVDPSTGGYWLVASDGGIFSFNAPFYGSTGSMTLNRPVVGMAESNGGSGYWLVASDGGIFSFKAPFYGSAGSLRLNKPVVGMAPDLATGGYWLVASDGGIFSFNASFAGSTGSLALNRPIVGMESNAAGTGYRFVASDGGVFDFGTSAFFGSAVAPSGASAFPFATSISSNHRYVLDQFGHPYMIVGDSAHSLSVDLSTSEMNTYFADRQAHGFNSVLVQLIAGQYAGNQNANSANYATYDGITPFTTDGDISTPNPVYFSRMQTMAQLAENHGITLFLDPADTGQLLDSSSFLADNGATKDYNYGVFLGNTFKNFPNIAWQSGNDYGAWGPTNDAYVLGIAKGIRSVAPNQLQTVELFSDVEGSSVQTVNLSSDDPAWASFINLNGAYTYYSPYSTILQGYNFSPTIPVFGMEYNYEFENNTGANAGSSFDLRAQEYWTMTSGATGQLYGSHYTWNDPSWADEQSHLDSPGAIQIGYMANLFKSVAWYNLVPDQGHTFVTAGYGTFQNNDGIEATDNYVTAAITADGTLGIAYLPQHTTVTVNMAKMSGPTTARWYDPTTGAYAAIGTIANTGTYQFTSPANHSDGTDDWVLVLQA